MLVKYKCTTSLNLLNFSMLSILPSMADIPWDKWEMLSEKGEKMDTWNKGCDCEYGQIPLDWEFMLLSNIILIRAIACPLLNRCKAVDYWRWLNDVTFIRYSYLVKKYQLRLIK